MASLRAKAPLPVGSSSWISAERENAAQMSSQDVEDFTFAACNDVEWLNEHMADIFSKNQFEVTEIFKTPGKLRGKTPRTARKRNHLEQRLPLTDIFAPAQSAIPSPLREPQAYRQAPQFLVAEDEEHTNIAAQSVAQESQKSNTPRKGDEGKESGDAVEFDVNNAAMDVDDHGISRSNDAKIESRPVIAHEEMRLDSVQKAASPLPQQITRIVEVDTSKAQKEPVDHQEYTSQAALRNTHTELQTGTYQSSTQQSYDSAYASQDTQIASFSQSKPVQRLADPLPAPIHVPTKLALDDSHDSNADRPMDDAKSGSEGSSPVRPVIRKSSLNFASLPAREPLTTKKSFGARTSRTSHIDGSKSIGPLRTSYHASKGVSNAHVESDDDSDVEMDIDDRPVMPREESDGDRKLMKIHNKTSTQRLHDKINALGQSQASRPTKSIPSAMSNASHSIHPDIPQTEVELSNPGRTAQHAKSSVRPAAKEVFEDEDEDDWIPSKTVAAAPQNRPQLLKSYSTDVMEQIRNKDSIGGLEGLPISPQSLSRTLSKSPIGSPAPYEPIKHGKAASVSEITVQPRPATALDGHGKSISVSNPDISSRYESQQQTSYTPAGTPASRIQGDGPISASKAKLSSILKSARGIFASSAGVSAQAKMETLSPRTIRVRENAENPSLNSLLASHAAHQKPKSGLYPSLGNTLESAIRVPSNSSGSPKKDEGRRTRSSSEREEKKKEKEAKEMQKMEENLDKARDKEAQKALAHKLEKERVASQEKQYLLKKEQEKAARAVQMEQPTRKSPRKPKAKDDEEMAPHMRRAEDVDTAMVDGQAVEEQQAKSREPRRPMKPIKEMAAKSKPAPVSIRVGTASQWELDHRKIGQIHPSNSTLAATLQDTLATGPPKPATLHSKASNSSISTVASGGNTLKSSVSAGAKPKALLAAAKKKEQDEKEALRKADHKREIDRKRAAQHEEDRRQESQQTQQRKEMDRQQRERSAQPEEARKAAQKQAIEKRRLENAKKVEPQRNPTGPRPKPPSTLVSSEKLSTSQAAQRGELGAARPPSRMNAAPPRIVQEPLSRSTNQPPVNTARPPKRPHQAEPEEFPFRGQEKTGQGYHQQDGKRRRTNEEAEAADARPPMAPPIRQSNIRTKDAPVKSIFSHGYGSTQPTSSLQQSSSTIKTVMSGPGYPQASKATHPRDMAKFATAKIPFGDNSGNHAGNTIHKTPARPATATSKSSPRYQNGDSIELPEIATDSEDDDDDNDFAVPDWAANSPIITDQLIRQDSWNPEEVFGPIAPLHMEEIFRNKDRHHRFRSRTSSANWSGQDRLTQEEILRDTEAREKLRANGGWTYGL